MDTRPAHCPSPFAAVLVDLDGHVIGLNPGRPFPMDDASVAATVLHLFLRLGSMLGHGDVNVVLVDAREGSLALVPLSTQRLVVALAVPAGVDMELLRNRARTLSIRELPAVLPAEPVSVLLLSADHIRALVEVLGRTLAQLGCSELALGRDAHRRRVSTLAHQCCAGLPSPAARDCLDSLCRSSGAAPVERVLGTGSFGSAYGLMDGTVLKVTRDVSEARATASLVMRPMRRFPVVRRVFRWVVLGRPTGCFGIVREPVDDAGALTGVMADAARAACDFLIAVRSGEGVEAAERRLAAMSGWDIALPFAREFDSELRARGIRFGDYQPQNLGLVRGCLCFFDLSLASGPPVAVDDIDVAG